MRITRRGRAATQRGAGVRRGAVDIAGAPGYLCGMRSAVLASLLILAACGDDGGSSGPDASTVAVTRVQCGGATISATVTAPGFMFMPESSTISVGQIVQFDMPGA